MAVVSGDNLSKGKSKKPIKLTKRKIVKKVMARLTVRIKSNIVVTKTREWSSGPIASR